MARRGDALPKATPLKAAPRLEQQIAFQLGISAESRAVAWLITKASAFWRDADALARFCHALMYSAAFFSSGA